MFYAFCIPEYGSFMMHWCFGGVMMSVFYFLHMWQWRIWSVMMELQRGPTSCPRTCSPSWTSPTRGPRQWTNLKDCVCVRRTVIDCHTLCGYVCVCDGFVDWLSDDCVCVCMWVKGTKGVPTAIINHVCDVIGMCLKYAIKFHTSKAMRDYFF